MFPGRKKPLSAQPSVCKNALVNLCVCTTGCRELKVCLTLKKNKHQNLLENMVNPSGLLMCWVNKLGSEVTYCQRHGDGGDARQRQAGQ